MCQLRQLWVALLFIWLVDRNLALTMSSIQWGWDVLQGGFSGNRNWDGVWGAIHFLRINPCEKKEKMDCTEGRAKIQHCPVTSSVKSVVGILEGFHSEFSCIGPKYLDSTNPPQNVQNVGCLRKDMTLSEAGLCNQSKPWRSWQQEAVYWPLFKWTAIPSLKGNQWHRGGIRVSLAVYPKC